MIIIKKKFAFLLMGEHYTPEKHQIQFETENQITGIYTVKNFEQALSKVMELETDGFGAIELCGAFGKDGADKISTITHNSIAVGYVTHNPVHDHLFTNFFRK